MKKIHDSILTVQCFDSATPTFRNWMKIISKTGLTTKSFPICLKQHIFNNIWRYPCISCSILDGIAIENLECKHSGRYWVIFANLRFSTLQTHREHQSSYFRHMQSIEKVCVGNTCAYFVDLVMIFCTKFAATHSVFWRIWQVNSGKTWSQNRPICTQNNAPNNKRWVWTCWGQFCAISSVFTEYWGP